MPLQPQDLYKTYKAQLTSHAPRVTVDPQSNPVKLLAFDISRELEGHKISLRDLKNLVSYINFEQAKNRASRLRERSGLNRMDELQRNLQDLLSRQAKGGFKAFKAFAETTAQGIVITAHPTFMMTEEYSEALVEVATLGPNGSQSAKEKLERTEIRRDTAPTLQDEHRQAQAAITRIHTAVDKINQQILEFARDAFPDNWTDLTPNLISVASWVGYDIDGRTDIRWEDSVRLKLQEKVAVLGGYISDLEAIGSDDLVKPVINRLKKAKASAEPEYEYFKTNLSESDKLVEAANHMSREDKDRILDIGDAIELLDKVIAKSEDDETTTQLLTLRAKMKRCGLGTAAIHLRVNATQVIDGLKGILDISASANLDAHSLLERAGRLAEDAKAQRINFASLELENRTIHKQLMMMAQLLKYVDGQTPIRFLIAECDQALIVVGVLLLARQYGVDHRIDISPLFETAEALRNGGRVIQQLLEQPAYRNHIEKRGVLAIQTGFSDAGRFMGQIPATLSIERIQSHMSSAMADHGLKDVRAIVFNTHGESNGRGGHPGNIARRLDYVMSPWARQRFVDNGVPLTHETSFQGGDGYLWFGSEPLADATLTSLVVARFTDTSKSKDDPFYKDSDFIWDIYTGLTSQQEMLYQDPNYGLVLGAFGQSFLRPAGSRATKRQGGDSGSPALFNPRQIRAIAHNSILQQLSVPANITFGFGQAGRLDPGRFVSVVENSERGECLLELVRTAWSRESLQTLSSYARLQDPGFWISRAVTDVEPYLETRCLDVADAFLDTDHHQRIARLIYTLRVDGKYQSDIFAETGRSLALRAGSPVETPDAADRHILHAIRMAAIMHMMLLACHLPYNGPAGASRFDSLELLRGLQVDDCIDMLEATYPASPDDSDWPDSLNEPTDLPLRRGGYAHIHDSVIKPMRRANLLMQTVSYAIAHTYDAMG